MNAIKTERSGKHLNTLEKYTCMKLSDRLHMNDTHIDIYSSIFEALQELNNR
jgi:hypothetical protein